MFLHSKSNRGSMFVRAGLRAVSTSFMLARYFVLIDAKVEKADSHKYVETNGRRTRIAKSANNGYYTLRLSQKVVSFFTAKSSFNFESEDVQQILLEHSERDARCFDLTR